MDRSVKRCSWGWEVMPSEIEVPPCMQGENLKEVYLTDMEFSLWLCPEHELELDLAGIFL